MKSLILALVLLGAMACRVCCADTSQRFVRIACVPEAGLLDVEHRYLHDSVANPPGARDQAQRRELLAKAGFRDPHGLTSSCDLGGVKYQITADQAETSNAMCGGDPSVRLSVTRNGEKVLSDIIFGDDCGGAPSVTRFTAGDGPKSWRGRETELCYFSGDGAERDHCEWTFGGAAEFAKRFPIDENRLRTIVKHQEHR